MKSLTKIVSSSIILITSCILTSCSSVPSEINDYIDNISESSNSSPTPLTPNTNENVNASDTEFSEDYLTFKRVVGQAVIEHDDAVKGHISYLPLDDMDRATGAYGYITRDMYEDAKGRNPSITVNPTGWNSNKKTTFTYDTNSDGKINKKSGDKSYKGWFWNRSHLIADSLGGDVSVNNLITGTRMQNVGWNDNKGGMAYTESKTRDFLEKNDNCEVYYSAKPNYKGNELVARTVTVDVKSCDNTLNERVIVDNNSPSHTIDYMTGEWKEN